MMYDAVVVGAGPNGLSAAIELARNGLRVSLLEANATIGGGASSAELTLPGYIHDICSAIHPMAALSPFFRSLDLDVQWIVPEAALAHPLNEDPPALLFQSLSQTAETLKDDGRKWRELFEPYIQNQDDLFAEILKPIRIPKHPLLMARFGFTAMKSADSLMRSRFSEAPARALFAGCAAHSLLSLRDPASASFGLILALGGHATGWPLLRSGSQQIANALAAKLTAMGGEVHTQQRIRSFRDLPQAKSYVFDLTPRQLCTIAGEQLSQTYIRRLNKFQYGPGVFKIDWALDGPIPWKSADCLKAATVHLGGTAEEIVDAEQQVSKGVVAERPFVLLAQQSLFDPTRAPVGKHTGWAYCHVPNGSEVDMTEPIEAQVERFAPGFRDRILARHTYNSTQLEHHNPNLIGGDISGGSNNLLQLFARPVFSLDPYATPNPRVFICSSSTPPGGGVHGMCGYNAARSVLKKAFGR